MSKEKQPKDPAEQGKEIKTAADLIQDANNYRKHSEQNKERIRKSIYEAGLGRSVVIDADGVLVAGNGVQQVIDGDTPVKVVETDGTELVVVKRTDLHTGDPRRKTLALADNATADDVEWDFDAIAEDWTEDEAGEWGVEWPADEEEGKQQEAQEDDFDETVDKVETVCKEGDIWKLGNHRLMCGDSTTPEDVTKLMAGERADMIFTDPPYGVNIKAVGNKQNRILGDITQTAIPFSFDMACRLGLKPKAHLYFCGSEKNLAMYEKLFDRYLHNIPRHLIWVKNGFTMKQNGYHNQYEIIYFGYNEGAGDIWYGGRKEEDASDVWRINKDKASDYVHPTQKPVEIPARAIRNSSPVGGSVLDLFGGSGSTMIACEQLDRKCYMMELDPHYCDVIIARWEKLTGNKAEKLK